MSRASSLRARLVIVIASALIGAGAVELCWPTSLEAHDRWGFPIACGSGFSADYDQAAIADHDPVSGGHGYVAECESAISWRRVWATALAAVGAVGLIVLGFLARRARNSTPLRVAWGN